MATDEAPVAPPWHHFLRILGLLLLLMLVFSVGATVAVVDSAAADAGNDTENATFASFEVGFEPASPEAPNDVRINWTLSGNVSEVDAVRVTIANESDEPINLYKPGGPNVPNPFRVAESGDNGASADLRVDDLSTVELLLKLPPGHCERVDEVRVVVLDEEGSGDGAAPPKNSSTANATVATIERSAHCGNATPGEFAVAIDDYDDSVRVGDVATVNATVTNTGGREATQTVRFLVDGAEQDTVTLTLEPNESAQLQFSVEPTAADVGDLPVAVGSDDDRANRTIQVREAPRANFSVAIENTTSPVAAGETLDVNARVENVGNATGTQSITLRDPDGTVVDVAENVSLSAGESTEVTLQWSTNDSDTGTGNVTVHSENETVTAPVTVTEPTVESVSVQLGDSVITTNETTSVTVQATYTNGTTRTVTDDAAIEALNQTVATVDGDTVVGEAPGTTLIEANFENETDAAEITVEAVETQDSDGANDSDDTDGSSDSNDSSDTDETDDSTDSTDSTDDGDSTDGNTDDGDSTDGNTDDGEPGGDDGTSGDENLDDGDDSDVISPEPEPPEKDWGSDGDLPTFPEDGPEPTHDGPGPNGDGPESTPVGPEPIADDPDVGGGDETISGEPVAEATPPRTEVVRRSSGVRLAFLPILILLLLPVFIRANRSWL